MVAHDAFAAAELFYAFEDAGRVHGNISPRTVLVGYSGEVKIAGYRPGSHVSVGPDAHVARDLKSLAGILCDLPFEMFPKELTKVVPLLLEDGLSPVEAMAAVRSFLLDHVPSADHRQKVAEWLNGLFPGLCHEEAQETERLWAAGTKLLAPSSVRPVSKRASVFRATSAMLALVGGGALLMAQRWPGKANSESKNIEALSEMASTGHALPVGHAAPEPAPPAPAAPVLVVPPDPATAPTSHAQPTADPPDNRPTKRGKQESESPAQRLLRVADAAFDAGERIEAIHLGTQALNAGGGVRAQLALAEYYRSMHRYREALNHYRAALESEPENELALAGVRMLEKKLTPCQ